MSADSELHAIEEVAATWMIERDGGLTRERERELQRWLAADARHAAAFEALEATWTMLAEAPACVAEDASAGSRVRRNPWITGLLVAAALAMAAVMSWQQPWRGPGRAVARESFVLAAATEIGMLRTVTLPDGSAIQLNTDSAVEVRFEPATRRVRLARGEAHFTVAKDASRPFIVNAGGVDVKVVGTVFNVRLRPDSVDVLVTEGKVRVAGHDAAQPKIPAALAATAELTAGQKLSVALGEATPRLEPAPVAVSPQEIKQTLAWQARRLDFDATPLEEIVAEVNRYSRHQLVLDDPRLKERKFGGSFPANDHATLVRMLEADFGVLAERRADRTVLRLKTP